MGASQPPPPPLQVRHLFLKEGEREREKKVHMIYGSELPSDTYPVHPPWNTCSASSTEILTQIVHMGEMVPSIYLWYCK